MLPLVKRSASAAARTAELTGLLRLLERFERDPSDLLSVLTYHRVGEPHRQPHGYPGLFSATPGGFADQAAHLARHHRVLSLEEVLEARRRRRPLPRRSLLLTFDDAYRDFAELAWPALRRRGLPATLFVPTAYPDHPERTPWWDRLHHACTATTRRDAVEAGFARLRLTTEPERVASFKQLRDHLKTLPDAEAAALVERVCEELGVPAREHDLLGWDELRSLAREGVTLAAHSRGHPLMTRIPVARMREEATGSRRDLERQIGSALPVFAYPSGDFDDRVVGILREEGFELAFTTCRGVNDLRKDDPLRLRRINVGLGTSPALLRTQLVAIVGRIQRRWLPTSPRSPIGAPGQGPMGGPPHGEARASEDG